MGGKVFGLSKHGEDTRKMGKERRNAEKLNGQKSVSLLVSLISFSSSWLVGCSSSYVFCLKERAFVVEPKQLNQEMAWRKG